MGYLEKLDFPFDKRKIIYNEDGLLVASWGDQCGIWVGAGLM